MYRDWVLKDSPWPQGQLEDKKLWSWPQKGLALALKTTGRGLKAFIFIQCAQSNEFYSNLCDYIQSA